MRIKDFKILQRKDVLNTISLECQSRKSRAMILNTKKKMTRDPLKLLPDAYMNPYSVLLLILSRLIKTLP